MSFITVYLQQRCFSTPLLLYIPYFIVRMMIFKLLFVWYKFWKNNKNIVSSNDINERRQSSGVQPLFLVLLLCYWLLVLYKTAYTGRRRTTHLFSLWNNFMLQMNSFYRIWLKRKVLSVLYLKKTYLKLSTVYFSSTWKVNFIIYDLYSNRENKSYHCWHKNNYLTMCIK